jgi:hypothetical protein
MDKPRYEHDCSVCLFLGTYNNMDLYWCGDSVTPTVVARYGNKWYEYKSGLALADMYPELAEARKRAADRGCLVTIKR